MLSVLFKMDQKYTSPCPVCHGTLSDVMKYEDMMIPLLDVSQVLPCGLSFIVNFNPSYWFQIFASIYQTLKVLIWDQFAPFM